VTYAVFLPASDPSYDWGCGVQPHECPPDTCWVWDDEMGGYLKLWGMATSLVRLDALKVGGYRIAKTAGRRGGGRSGFNLGFIYNPQFRLPGRVLEQQFGTTELLSEGPTGGRRKYGPQWGQPASAFGHLPVRARALVISTHDSAPARFPAAGRLWIPAVRAAGLPLPAVAAAG
jgi:hypothetical protein